MRFPRAGNPAPRAWSGTGERQFRRRAATVLCLAYALSRLVIFLAGVRMRGDLGTPQLMDPQSLKHGLMASLWHLHSHPPLLSLFMGVVFKFPARLQMTLVTMSSLLLGLAVVLVTFYLAAELRLRRWLCIGIPLVVIISPDYILFENFIMYAYATAAFMMLAALSLFRYFREQDWRWAFAYAMSLASLVLMNSTFQWPFLVLWLVPIALANRRQWGELARIALVPMVLVGGWYGKNLLQFHTLSTTSLVGMNLAKPILLNAPKGDVSRKVDQARIDPIAAVYPFLPLEAYVPKYVSPHRPTGIKVLDEVRKSSAGLSNPNYNNKDYLKISSRYLSADLKFLKRHPTVLLTSAVKGLRIFSMPADQYYVVGFDNRPKIQRYANLFDRWALLQAGPMLDRTFTYAAWAGRTPKWTQTSWTRVGVFGLTLFLLPWLLPRRRVDPAAFWLVLFIVVTTWYIVAFTSLGDLGENNRFSLDLGTLPLLGCAYAVTQLASFRPRRRQRSRTFE